MLKAITVILISIVIILGVTLLCGFIELERTSVIVQKTIGILTILVAVLVILMIRKPAKIAS